MAKISSPILMSSIGKLIKYVIVGERYAMQNWNCLGQKSNNINETHCEVLIYGRAASYTAVDWSTFFLFTIQTIRSGHPYRNEPKNLSPFIHVGV